VAGSKRGREKATGHVEPNSVALGLLHHIEELGRHALSCPRRIRIPREWAAAVESRRSGVGKADGGRRRGSQGGEGRRRREGREQSGRERAARWIQIPQERAVAVESKRSGDREG
jgi:hypothetical protein